MAAASAFRTILSAGKNVLLRVAIVIGKNRYVKYIYPMLRVAPIASADTYHTTGWKKPCRNWLPVF